MQIQLKDLELHPLEFDEEFAPESIELTRDLRLRSPLQAKGRAELIEEHHGGKKVVRDIRLVGDFQTTVLADCARCLEPVERRIGGHFDLLNRPQTENAGADEREISEAETEISFFAGDSIKLEDVLTEQVLLAAPVKVLCKEECMGLCPQCGRNRDSEACQCAPEFKDPRWAALEELRKKLEN